MKVTKRDGTIEVMDITKVERAMAKSIQEAYPYFSFEQCLEVAGKLSKEVENQLFDKIKVEAIQDIVEEVLMAYEPKAAKKYILYRQERQNLWKNGWNFTDLQRDIYNAKYRFQNEEFIDFIKRVGMNDREMQKLILEKKLIPAGRILAGIGVQSDDYKVSLANCHVLPIVQDTREDIYDTAKNLAITLGAGGGQGINLGGLRPRGAKVRNSARTSTGAVSFMELYDVTVRGIGGEGRRGALMLSMPVSHPDIEEFITSKTNTDRITGANISVMVDDKFMEAVENDRDYTLSFTVDATEEVFTKVVRAKDLFRKLAESNYNYAEPGILYWDTAENYNLMSEDPNYVLEGTNPCFAGHTRILTRDGYREIETMIGEEVEIWNGYEWSKVVHRQTGENQPMLRIFFSTGSMLEVTDYHEFILEDSSRVRAEELEVGDILKDYFFPADVPGIAGGHNEGVRVVTVERIANADRVYCTVEPKNHSILANGIMTANCGEQPLPAHSSCNLASINLSEFVINPFTEEAYIDIDGIVNTTNLGITYLDEVLDVNKDYLPLIEQRMQSMNWRQIGLGVMGFADMLIKLGVHYDSDEALEYADLVADIVFTTAVQTSLERAKKLGAFPMCNPELVANSPLLKNFSEEIKDDIAIHGLRNSHLTTIAPTGSISNLIGVSSGVEPHFALSYTRKTESIHGEDTYYTVNAPIVEEYLEVHPEDRDNLPDYFVTSMELPYMSRIKMQSVWQEYVDTAISSTANLPAETTIEEVEDLYMQAWKYGLKGITIFRDGGLREGILTLDKEEMDKEKQNKGKLEAREKEIEDGEYELFDPSCST